jgi:hypothetical protein
MPTDTNPISTPLSTNTTPSVGAVLINLEAERARRAVALADRQLAQAADDLAAFRAGRLGLDGLMKALVAPFVA